MNTTQECVNRKGPKNKKQIGRIGKGDKIYIEDYAVTYLNQIARASETKNGLAGLFGTCREIEGIKEYYIYAAAYQECESASGGNIPRETVQKIMRCRGELFPEYFFLGWALIFSENKGRMWENCYRSRMETLAGRPELLMTLKCKTCEEHFYLYPTEMPKETDGYFIFYEQNDAMQSFLIDWHGEINKDKCDEEGDNVAESCRNYYKEKKAKLFRKRLAGAAAMAAMLLLLFVLGTSVHRLNGYDKIQEMGDVAQEVNALSEEPEVQLVPIQMEVAAEDGKETDITAGGDDLIVAETEDVSVPEMPATEEIITTENAEAISSETPKEVVLEIEDVAELSQSETVQEEFVAANMSSESYITYEVAKGDTLYGICVRFYGDLRRAKEICEMNHIEDMDNILYGQKIILPQ